MRARSDDEGTILLLTCGLVIVLMALVVVVVDVSVVVLAKRGVASAADGAALVAAQQPDTRVLADRRDALSSALPLDRRAAVDAVAAYQRDAALSQPGLLLVASVAGPGNTEAVVRAQRTVSLPFVSWFGVKRVVVRAVGRARSPITS